jgi:hypothetical protein
MSDARTMTGQQAYEDNVRRRPYYHNGDPRRSWDQLDEVTQWSWNKNPTPREHAACGERATPLPHAAHANA